MFADETRPFLQGARLTAWELMQDGIPVTLIADSAARLLMSRGEIDLVIVGADRVAANGDTANKIGTYPLAVLAQRHGDPVLRRVPAVHHRPRTRPRRADPDRGARRRGGDRVRGVRWAPEGVAVRNPAFDVTPAALVTALITERGVVQRPDRAKLRALFADRSADASAEHARS